MAPQPAPLVEQGDELRAVHDDERRCAGGARIHRRFDIAEHAADTIEASRPEHRVDEFPARGSHAAHAQAAGQHDPDFLLAAARACGRFTVSQAPDAAEFRQPVEVFGRQIAKMNAARQRSANAGELRPPLHGFL